MGEEMEIKLMHDSFTEEELGAVVDCFRSGEYTQGRIVREFEQKFAAYVGTRYAVMVNSGSSANLLMAMLLREKFGLNDGDEVLVPAVTWPTTVYPLIQNRLKPVFCDVDDSYNMSLESVKRMTNQNTKAIFLVHLLGQPADIAGIVRFCQQRGIILLEDCCESLGARYLNIHVGNFGSMGSFSFYFGHHMSSIEGGMVVTNDEELYDLLKSARSHGWVRDSVRAETYKDYKIDKNFLFDMLGYNLRSTNLNAAIGLVQLKKLDKSITIRKENHRLFQELLKDESRVIPQKILLAETSSFSLGILLQQPEEREYLLANLPKRGIECRPIVAGNLLQQPYFKKRAGEYVQDTCTNADFIHTNGMYLPNNQFLDDEKIRYMVDSLIHLLNEKHQRDIKTYNPRQEHG